MDIKTIEGTQNYQIVRLIAEGGMGSVYEALQDGAVGFQKTVAIKTIRSRFAEDSEFVRLFIGEAKLVADLVHENIVQVYQLGSADSRYYIVMEYVDGINLEEFIRFHVDNGIPLPVELGAFIMSRVCRGLEYAHQRLGRDGSPLGIVHRDISPKNVLLNVEGVVKVTDFGIAKARDVMEQDEDILMGRMEYMSPEQSQRGITDGRSDLYSVGVLAYETLTSRPPVRGAGSLLRLHGLGLSYPQSIQEVRADIPDDLWAIIERALQPEPEERFQSAGEMGFALEYHLYHDGYGPTNVTLREYLRKHFGRGLEARREQPDDVDHRTAQVVEQRSQTLYGSALSEDEPA